MKEKLYDMRDDEIRILGNSSISPSKKGRRGKWWLWLIITIPLILLLLLLFFNFSCYNGPVDCARYYTDYDKACYLVALEDRREPFGQVVDNDVGGFCEIKDTIINDIPLKIYIPHNAEMALHIGRIPQDDKGIIYIAEAAGIRADNGEILGAFVLEGKPLAWGVSKMGYCASISGEVSIGLAANSPLFEKATEEGGYFFRQYPLVYNRTIVDNAPKGKSIRRGICDRSGEIFMVETITRESFHDFSQALVDLEIDNAVYLIGSTSFGWAVDEGGNRHEWGKIEPQSHHPKLSKNTNYIVWRNKQ